MKPTLVQLRQLVGNPDAYALQQEDGAYFPVRETLSAGVLMDHLRGKITVGTYINKGQLARTLVFDVDTGDATTATAISQELGGLGFFPAIESSGRKGFHVWVVFPEYVLAAYLRRLGRHVLVAAQVDPKTEVFPKQDEATDLGNLVKLPGALHRVSGKRSELFGPIRLSPVKTLYGMIETLPEVSAPRRHDTDDVPFKCVQDICAGVEEGGRNDSMYHLAAMARRRLGLSGVALESLLLSVNEAFTPPLDPFEVERVASSSANGGPLCERLGRPCGQACVFQVEGGRLFTRYNAVRSAAAGERTVVEVSGREGDVVSITHPDLVGELKGRVRP